MSCIHPITTRAHTTPHPSYTTPITINTQYVLGSPRRYPITTAPVAVVTTISGVAHRLLPSTPPSVRVQSEVLNTRKKAVSPSRFISPVNSRFTTGVFAVASAPPSFHVCVHVALVGSRVHRVTEKEFGGWFAGFEEAFTIETKPSARVNSPPNSSLVLLDNRVISISSIN